MPASTQNIVHFPGETDLNDVQIQAVDWGNLLQSGDATEEDQTKFEAWIAESTDHADAYRLLTQWWRDLDYVTANDPKLENVVSAYAANDRAKANPFLSPALLRKMMGGVAAALVMVMFAWMVAGPGETQQATYYQTRVGKLKTIELPDGTNVVLAGDSVFSTNFTEKERSAELISGQAYFDVSSNKERPFVVKVGNTRVRVVGTEFDIQKAGNDVRVSVVEGIVEVAAKSNAQSSKHLTAGEQLFAGLDGGLGEIQTFQPETDIAWKQGRLEYINAPLSRVINEVNRYRDQKIVLQDKSLSNYPITISLAFDETDRLLTGLKYAKVAQIVRQGSMVLIEEK